jgi:predicted PurR-regulated permease PerM
VSCAFFQSAASTKLRKEHHSKLQEILSQIKGSVQSYISGLIIEMIFVSILTSIGLYIIGVPYFMLLGTWVS